MSKRKPKRRIPHEAHEARRRKPGETSFARYELRMTEREKTHYQQQADARGEAMAEVIRQSLEERYGAPPAD